MTKGPDLHAAGEEAWQHALRREAVIRPLAALPALKRAGLDDAVARLGLAKVSGATTPHGQADIVA
jgi:hypothetical protein